MKPEFKVLVVGAHIGTLVIPVAKKVESLGVTVGKEKFQDTLQAMYDAEEGGNGIMFTK